MAIFTGRPRDEAELTLKRFAGPVVFHPMLCMGETRNPKPHPEGLLEIVGGQMEPRSTTGGRARTRASAPPMPHRPST